jgi:hypothetical protein
MALESFDRRNHVLHDGGLADCPRGAGGMSWGPEVVFVLDDPDQLHARRDTLRARPNRQEGHYAFHTQGSPSAFGRQHVDEQLFSVVRGGASWWKVKPGRRVFWRAHEV